MAEITGKHVLLKDKNGNCLLPETIKTNVIAVDNLYVPTSDAVSKAIASAVSGKANTSHGTHVASNTCVTGIKLGSSTSVSKGEVTITPSSIGAQAAGSYASASHGTHVSNTTCVTSFNGSKGDVSGISLNGNISWKTSNDLGYDTGNKYMYFTTPASDCFVVIFTNLNKEKQVFITVNDVVVTVFYEGANGGGANCCFPVKANKTVKIYYNEDHRSKLITPVYNASDATPFNSKWCLGIMT